jgi:hypothetical protein
MFTRAERIALRVSFLFLETRKGREAGLLPDQYDALRAAHDKINRDAHRNENLKAALFEAKHALLPIARGNAAGARHGRAVAALRKVEMALTQLP